ncbi:MAG: hypothetical protein Ct9H300mP7_4130 [Verrucomicrobiota bacterium]|nr:MAG: hypothetical protein Ct9H300mP7_4130 [Verrucomicrobiota bacterium]
MDESTQQKIDDYLAQKKVTPNVLSGGTGFRQGQGQKKMKAGAIRRRSPPVEPFLQHRSTRGRSRAEGHPAQSMRWGLIPPWAKDKSIGAKLANARAETSMRSQLPTAVSVAALPSAGGRLLRVGIGKRQAAGFLLDA